MYFEWNDAKNREIKDTRGVCFEDFIQAFENDRVIDIVTPHNTQKYPNQKMFIVELYEYIYYVPFVRDEEKYFLKSMIPSRKLTKKYKEK